MIVFSEFAGHMQKVNIVPAMLEHNLMHMSLVIYFTLAYEVNIFNQ